MRTLSQVAIVGRPNVGKSRFFNRLGNSSSAIVDPVAGSTRDRNVTTVEWGQHHFELVDTGGIFEDLDTPLEKQVALQVDVAISEASLVCWVVDARTGLLPEEQYLGKRLRAISQPVFLIVNKVDSQRQSSEADEFQKLGFKKFYKVSSEHGLGFTDLIDDIIAELPEPVISVESDEIRVALTGRPNVGKSSLMNHLIGGQRSIVSSSAGTTRDAIDTMLSYENQQFRFVDTAGIRKKGKIRNRADRLGVRAAEKAIERSHLSLLMLDSTGEVTTEDASIGAKIADAGRGAVIVFNKWDLINGRESKAKELVKIISERMPHLTFAPIIFLSALTGRGVKAIYDRILSVRTQQLVRIQTADLNRFMEKVIARVPPRAKTGKPVKFYYTTQVGISPPRFVIFSNRSRSELDSNYTRYLTRQLREQYGFEGTPIRVTVRKRKGLNSQ